MSLPININNLINGQTVESNRIEFKKGWNPEEILRTSCAFANDINDCGSGYIIIGIEEIDGIPVLPPFGLQQNQLDAYQKDFISLCHKIRPKIFPEISVEIVDGKHILVIWVTTGEERPYSVPSTLGKEAPYRMYVRQGTATVPTNPILEKHLRELATYRHFDDRVNTQASINDLDLGLIQAYLQEIKSNLYEETTKLSLSDIALKMQIARGTNENIKPLNIGLLLFSRNPEKYFPGCKTNLIEFEDEAGTKYSDKTFAGPIHIQIRDIMSYFNSNIIKQYKNKDPLKSEIDKFYNYPYQAIEELVVNALYHRSYSNPMPNEIRIHKTFIKGVDKNEDTRYIEFLSYPGPMPPIDENSLLSMNIAARNYRNIRLGDFLKNMRLAEKYATGIPTVRKSLKDNGSSDLFLSTDEARSYFLAIIKINENTPIDIEESYKEIERIQLSNLQQNILDKLLKEPSSEEEIVREVNMEIKNDINYLISKNMISKKQYGEINIYHITGMGIETLRQLF